VVLSGPSGVKQQTASSARYPTVDQFTLSISDNGQTRRGYLLVGRLHPGAPWTTLGAPGTHPE
jgi:hypothetical protein